MRWSAREAEMFVYVAGPYTLGDVVQNVRAACAAAEAIVRAGHTPFVPHLCHLWHLVSPHHHEYWMDYDRAWLEKCDVVVRLVGDSRGADIECARAAELGIPVMSLEDCLALPVGGLVVEPR